MPQRRGWAGALHGIGEAGEEGVQQIFRQQMQERNQARAADLAFEKDLSDKVIAGLDPQQAESAMRLRGHPVPKGYFDTLQPSITDRTQQALAPVNAATGAENFPTQEQINLGLQAKGVNPFAGSGSPFTMPGSFDETNPTAASIFGAKRTALQTAQPPEVIGKGMSPTGAPTQTVGQFNKFAGTPDAGSFVNKMEQTIGPTSQQTGEAQAAIEKIIGPQKAATAGLTTTAERTASEPFDKTMAKYRNDLEQGNKQLTTVNDPNTGEEKLALVDKRGNMTIVATPEGLVGGKAKQIPATIADNVAGLSTAEIEGVKILRELRKSGLGESNDPLDPRWQKFLVNTLKVAPEDAMKGDIQQRVGFVNATLTRALMGSRPSQYVAKEIIQPHLPKQEMTGLQLQRVLTNVLEQANERRQEFAHTLGVPLQRLSPTKGSYADYQKEFGIESNAPAQYTIDVKTGKLVPIGRQPQ